MSAFKMIITRALSSHVSRCQCTCWCSFARRRATYIQAPHRMMKLEIELCANQPPSGKLCPAFQRSRRSASHLSRNINEKSSPNQIKAKAVALFAGMKVESEVTSSEHGKGHYYRQPTALLPAASTEANAVGHIYRGGHHGMKRSC